MHSHTSKPKRQYLDERRQELEIAYKQLSRTLDDVHGLRIKRRIQDLEQEIHQLENELEQEEQKPGFYGKNPVSQPMNPFGDAGRIADPARFFDRQDLMRQIFEELSKGVNLSLVGSSQSGKSSLLSMVCTLGPQRLGLPPEVFAYLSLQIAHDEGDFFEAVCSELQIAPCRGNKLYRALRGRRCVLCLDEAEVINSESFSLNTRRELRGLADGPDAPLKLVIASRRELARLFPDSPELDSPLAGICHQLDVGAFPPEVARAFLAERLRGTGVTFGEDEIAELIARSGGNPGLLQRAAAELFKEKRNLVS